MKAYLHSLKCTELPITVSLDKMCGKNVVWIRILFEVFEKTTALFVMAIEFIDNVWCKIKRG
jgi:hypothetical protein